MRVWPWAVGMSVLLSGVCLGQEEPTLDQLKKMYEDALGQLKNAQVAKTELATENQKLTAHVADLERQLAEARGQLDEMKRDADTWAEKTFVLRAHYAAWKSFLRYYPALKARWDVFLENQVPAPPTDGPSWIDRDWPFSGGE